MQLWRKDEIQRRNTLQCRIELSGFYVTPVGGRVWSASIFGTHCIRPGLLLTKDFQGTCSASASASALPVPLVNIVEWRQFPGWQLFPASSIKTFVISPQNILQICPQNELSIFQYRKLAEYFFRPNSGPIRNNLNLLFSRGFRYSPQSAKCRNEQKQFECLSFNRWKMFEL